MSKLLPLLHYSADVTYLRMKRRRLCVPTQMYRKLPDKDIQNAIMKTDLDGATGRRVIMINVRFLLEEENRPTDGRTLKRQKRTVVFPD